MAYGIDLLLCIKVELWSLLQHVCRVPSTQSYVKLLVPRPIVLWYADMTKTKLIIRIAS